MFHHPLPLSAKNRGMTLIEIMVTVAIIAILAGIGWPMFEKQMAKQRVSDAVLTLTTIQAQLEKCLLNTGTYAGCAPCGTSDGPSMGGNYKITVQCDATLNAYMATAIPYDTTQEALGLSSLGHKTGPWP